MTFCVLVILERTLYSTKKIKIRIQVTKIEMKSFNLNNDDGDSMMIISQILKGTALNLYLKLQRKNQSITFKDMKKEPRKRRNKY